MKTVLTVVTAPASCIVAVQALPSQQAFSTLPDNTTIPNGYGHYNTVNCADQPGQSLFMLAKGYNGPAKSLKITADNITSMRTRLGSTGFPLITSLSEADSNSIDPPQRLDVRVTGRCAIFRTCVSQYCSATKYPAGILCSPVKDLCISKSIMGFDYFSENNYANTIAVVKEGAKGIAINVSSTPAQSVWMNPRLSQQTSNSPIGSPDSCDLKGPGFRAYDYAQSIYQFCIAIQHAKSTAPQARGYVGGDTNGKALGGEVALAKKFHCRTGR